MIWSNKHVAITFIVLSLIALAFINLTGCTTAHSVQSVETTLQPQGRSTYGEIGINDDGQAVVQVRKSAEVELRSQEMANYAIAERVRDEAFHLHSCRESLADPGLGGSGEVAPIPSVDGLKPIVKVKEEMGLAEDGSLQVVTKEFLDERLKAERKFQAALEQMEQTIKPLREDCERKLSYRLAQPYSTTISDKTVRILYNSK